MNAEGIIETVTLIFKKETMQLATGNRTTLGETQIEEPYLFRSTAKVEGGGEEHAAYMTSVRGYGDETLARRHLKHR